MVRALIVFSLVCQYIVYAAPFREWVSGLRLQVPALTLADVKIPILGTFDVNVTGGNCTSFDIMNVGGHAAPFNATDPRTNMSALGGMNLSIHVTAGFDCTVQASAEIPLIGKVAVTVKVSILPTTSAKIGLSVASDMNETAPLPNAISIPASLCHMEVALHSLSFQASSKFVQGALNDFVDLTGLIEIANILDSGICALVKNPKLVTMFTDLNLLLSFVSKQLRGIHAFDPRTSLTPPSSDRTPRAYDMHHLLEDSPSGHVIRAILLDVGHLDNLTKVNRELAKVLGGATVTKALAGPFHVNLLGINVTATNLVPSSVGLSMLNGSISTNVIDSQVGFDQIGAKGTLKASLFDFNNTLVQSTNGPLDIPLSQMEIGVGHLGLAMGSFAYLDSELVAPYHLDQLQHGGCICRSLGQNPWGDEKLEFALPTESTMQLGSLAMLDLNLAVRALSLQWDIGAVVPELKGVELLVSELIDATTKVFGSTVYAGVNGAGVKELLHNMNGKLYDFGATCDGQCPATITGGLYQDEKDTADVMAILGGMGFFIGSVLLLSSAYTVIQKKRGRQLPVTVEPPDAAALLMSVEEHTGSLFSNKQMARPIAIAVPAFLVCVLAMYVVAQTQWFFATSIIFADGQGVDRIVIRNLDIWGSLQALWATGTWYLSVAVFLASVVFPYFKLGLYLCLWFLPETSLTPQKRELILVILDQIAKISLLDCVLFLMLMVGLQSRWTHGGSNDVYFKLGAVVPLGFLFQWLAAFSSIVVGQFMLVCHRAVGGEQKRYMHHASVMTSQALSNPQSIASLSRSQLRAGSTASVFRSRLLSGLNATTTSMDQASVPPGGSPDAASPMSASPESMEAPASIQTSEPTDTLCLAHMVGQRRVGRFSLLLAATLILILVGVFAVDTINFTFGGAAASGFELLGTPVFTSYSMWQIFSGIYLTNYGLEFGEVLVCVILVVFCLLIPVAYVVTLLVLWNCSLTAKAQFHTWVVLQVLQSWASVDILAVALVLTGIFASTLKAMISDVVLNSNIGPICNGIGTVGIKCIEFETSITWYVGLLVVAAVSLHLCGFYVYRLMITVREGKLVSTC